MAGPDLLALRLSIIRDRASTSESYGEGGSSMVQTSSEYSGGVPAYVKAEGGGEGGRNGGAEGAGIATGTDRSFRGRRIIFKGGGGSENRKGVDRWKGDGMGAHNDTPSNFERPCPEAPEAFLLSVLAD